MPRISRSWFLALLGFLVLGFSRGINSSFGVFYVALLNTFGWSRGATAGVFSVNLVVDAILSPVVGHLLDRYGPKRVVGVGCLFLVSGLWLSSQVTSLWQFYLFFGLVCALGFSFMGMVPHVVLISEWFTSNRASALGLVFAGTGVGLLVLAPLVLGFYRRGPYGGLPSKENGREGKDQWTTRLALMSLQFWLLFIARVVAAGGTTMIVTHQVAHVVDIGYSRLYAATVFGLMGVTSTFGRVIFGAIADLVSKRAAYTLNIATTVVGVAALMIAGDTTQPWLLYIYLLFFGIGFGSRAVIFSALTADIFSGKKFGAILGFSVISVGLGGALGSWLGGALYDFTGSYLISFSLSTLGLVLSDLCVWLATFAWVAAYDARLWRKNEF